MSVCLPECVHTTCVSGVRRGQKVELDPPKVELQTVVKHHVLGTELESSIRMLLTPVFLSSFMNSFFFFFIKGQRVFTDSFSREDIEMSLEQRCSASVAT